MTNNKDNHQQSSTTLPEPTLVRFDWAMKNLLRSKANFDILEGFLSELLKESVKIDSLLESESNQEYADNRFNRVDLLVTTANGEKIIIEVQTASEWDFYHRILFGTSKVITEYINKGQEYSNVPKVISVSILFFNLGVGSDYVYKGVTSFTGVHNNDQLQLTEQSIKLYLKELNKEHTSPSDIFPTYYLIQLKQFTNIVKDKFDEWVYLLKNESIKAGFNAQGILSAKHKLDVLKLSPQERIAYDKYWQDVSFDASLAQTHKVELKQASRDGEAKGKAEGKAEAKLEIAKQLLVSGVETSLIATATGLTCEQINELKRSI